MYWRLLPHATCCLAADRLVLLDLRQDRYFMVPQAVAGATLDWLLAEEHGAPPEAMTALLRSGAIFRTGDPPLRADEQATIDVSANLADRDPATSRATVADCARVMALVTATWAMLHLRSLDRILAQKLAQRVDATDGREHLAVARAVAFDAVRRFSPLPRNCLLDSLALYAWLARDRIDVKLVFGVTAQPFAAHCWLQSGPVIVNDNYDRVSRFTPILNL
jgi:hypothetical protein